MLRVSDVLPTPPIPLIPLSDLIEDSFSLSEMLEPETASRMLLKTCTPLEQPCRISPESFWPNHSSPSAETEEKKEGGRDSAKPTLEQILKYGPGEPDLLPQ